MNTVFITGTTSGFGLECARKFGKNGWKVISVGRREDRLKRLEEELSPHTSIYSICMDIREKDRVFKEIGSLPEEFKDIDVLINNAGLSLGLEKAYECDISDWDIMIDTNIKGLIYCTRAILPGMVKRNRGTIINLGSIASRWPYTGGNVYGATKAFVRQFSRNLRADLLGTDIRVCCVEPGLAETEFSIVRFKGDRERAKKVYEGTRSLEAKDIAEIIYWISNLPSHININTIEIMPVCQAWSTLKIHRKNDKEEL